MLLEEYKNQNDDMIHMFLVYISKESTLGDLYEYVKENKETYRYPMYFYVTMSRIDFIGNTNVLCIVECTVRDLLRLSSLTYISDYMLYPFTAKVFCCLEDHLQIDETLLNQYLEGSNEQQRTTIHIHLSTLIKEHPHLISTIQTQLYSVSNDVDFYSIPSFSSFDQLFSTIYNNFMTPKDPSLKKNSSIPISIQSTNHLFEYVPQQDSDP